MRGVDFYYRKFHQAIAAYSPDMCREFDALTSGSTPREVFVWLEQRRLDGKIPSELEDLLTDFYWEIS